MTGLLHRDFRVAAHYRLNGVVTVVDALMARQASATHPAMIQQIGAADRIVLSKLDLVATETASALRRWVVSLNPVAEVVCADIEDPLVMTAAGWRMGRLLPSPGVETHGSMPSASVTILDWVDEAALAAWLDLLIATAGPTLLRLKGIVRCTPETAPLAVHAVQGVAHPAVRLADDAGTSAKGSALVLIGEALWHPAVRAVLGTATSLFHATVRYRDAHGDLKSPATS